MRYALRIILLLIVAFSAIIPQFFRKFAIEDATRKDRLLPTRSGKVFLCIAAVSLLLTLGTTIYDDQAAQHEKLIAASETRGVRETVQRQAGQIDGLREALLSRMDAMQKAIEPRVALKFESKTVPHGATPVSVRVGFAAGLSVTPEYARRVLYLTSAVLARCSIDLQVIGPAVVDASFLVSSRADIQRWQNAGNTINFVTAIDWCDGDGPGPGRLLGCTITNKMVLLTKGPEKVTAAVLAHELAHLGGIRHRDDSSIMSPILKMPFADLDQFPVFSSKECGAITSALGSASNR